MTFKTWVPACAGTSGRQAASMTNGNVRLGQSAVRSAPGAEAVLEGAGRHGRLRAVDRASDLTRAPAWTRSAAPRRLALRVASRPDGARIRRSAWSAVFSSSASPCAVCGGRWALPSAPALPSPTCSSRRGRPCRAMRSITPPGPDDWPAAGALTAAELPLDRDVNMLPKKLPPRGGCAAVRCGPRARRRCRWSSSTWRARQTPLHFCTLRRQADVGRDRSIRG